MVGLFASMAAKWALDKLASFLPVAASSSSSSATASQDVELLRRLERTMLRIRATLHDAEEHWNIREESAKLRLKELKELAYAAEDVMEEYDNEVDRCQPEATAAASGSNCKRKRKRQEENETYSIVAGMVPVPRELVDEAKRIIERFDEIMKYSVNFTLSKNDGKRRVVPDIHSSRMTSSIVIDKNILGRLDDKEEIVKILVPKQGNNIAPTFSVLAIVGMGGLGKTTLAQLVYNDPMVRQCFELFAWVCVSEQFDVTTITKNIMSAITEHSRKRKNGKKKESKKEKEVTLALAQLQEKLVNEIQGKRVLLVLDDVWNERSDLWELLLMPMSRTQICNILVTSRSEAVARLVQTMPLYRINCLSPNESWSLFKQVSLAVHQDNDTPKNLVEIGKNIVEKCKGLPLAIKALGSMLRCETEEARWRDVLESKLWDLLEESRSSGVLPALKLSYKHMPIYLKRCFVALSLFPKDFLLEESHMVKLWKSLDLLECDKNGKAEDDDIARIYINELVQRSLLEVDIEEEDVYTMHDLIHDLACLLGEEEFFTVQGGTSIEIPPTVRYISVSGHGACLKNLTASHSIRAIIFLDGYKPQVELPLNCKKLRVVTRCFNSGKRMLLPCGVGCAINIHTLQIAISRCSCFCNIRELQSLKKIREVYLSGLSNVACMEDAERAQLESKKHLRSLALDFSSSRYHCCEDTVQGNEAAVTLVPDEQLLESLRPHHVLRKLEIRFYKSQRYPSWLGNASYSSLTEVRLFCIQSHHLPTLGELPSLRSLLVYRMDQVEYIGREFCSHISGVKGFPSLTWLEFSSAKKLSEWSDVDVGEFPCLQTLSLKYADNLRALPSVPFMSLVTLHLENCGNLATIPESATLHELVIQYCEGLHELPALVSLGKLEIEDCPKLSAVGSLPSLTTLHITGPFHGEDIFYRLLNCHPSLECISVKCYTTRRITLEPQSLPSLKKLHLTGWDLQYCHGLADLNSLQELNVQGCPNLPIHNLRPRNLHNLIVERFLFPKNHFDGV